MFFSQFWKLEVQDQGCGIVRVWWGPASRFIDGSFSVCSQVVEGAPRVSYKRALIPLHPHDLITSQKGHLQMLAHWN